MNSKYFSVLQQNYRELIKGFETLVFPPNHSCPFCKQKMAKGRHLCHACELKLQLWQEEVKCKICGRLVGEVGRCFSCQKNIPLFKFARSVAPYEGDFQMAIKRFKYNGEKWLAEPLGNMMSDLIKGEPLFKEIDLLIPIPLSKKRLAERGFNQSLLLAKTIGKNLDIPYRDDILFKIRETQDQIGLKRSERLSNLEGAFEVKKPLALKGVRVLLVDDIFTTGSTAHHSSKTLLEAGAEEIKVITWAGVTA